MTEYINMWQNFFNFTDRTSVRGYWMAFLINLAAGFVLGIVTRVLHLSFLTTLYSIAIFIPSLALTIRRLRDAGRSWICIFLPLIPLVGVIILIVFLCSPSRGDYSVPLV